MVVRRVYLSDTTKQGLNVTREDCQNGSFPEAASGLASVFRAAVRVNSGDWTPEAFSGGRMRREGRFMGKKKAAKPGVSLWPTIPGRRAAALARDERESALRTTTVEALLTYGCNVVPFGASDKTNGIPDVQLITCFGIFYVEFKGIDTPIQDNQRVFAYKANATSLFAGNGPCCFVYRFLPQVGSDIRQAALETVTGYVIGKFNCLSNKGGARDEGFHKLSLMLSWFNADNALLRYMMYKNFQHSMYGNPLVKLGLTYVEACSKAPCSVEEITYLCSLFGVDRYLLFKPTGGDMPNQYVQRYTLPEVEACNGQGSLPTYFDFSNAVRGTHHAINSAGDCSFVSYSLEALAKEVAARDYFQGAGSQRLVMNYQARKLFFNLTN